MRRTINHSVWNDLLNKLTPTESADDWGIRCLLPVNKKEKRTTDPIAWFGTGVWKGRPYYHLGIHFNHGYGAVDICGFYKNSYCYKVDSNLLNLKSNIVNGFDIDQEWSEKWRN